jgi:hypothetical protein
MTASTAQNDPGDVIMVNVVVAVLVVVPVILGAQLPSAPAGDGKREFTVSGCLLRSGYAGYQIDEAQVDAIDGKSTVVPQGAPSAASGPPVPKKWILEGGGNLGARIGEKVQVVGRSDWQPPSSGAAADEPPNRTPRLAVQSVKTIAAKCS